MTTQLNPVSDRIVVRRLPGESVSPGGILIPDPEKPDQGIVIATGPGARQADGSVAEMGVKVGDRVLFHKYAGARITVNDEELIVMREEDVFAVVVVDP